MKKNQGLCVNVPCGERSAWGRRPEASLGSGASAGASLSPRQKGTVTDSAAVPRLSSAVLRTTSQQRLTRGEDILDTGTGHALHGHLIQLSPKPYRRSHCCPYLTAEQTAAQKGLTPGSVYLPLPPDTDLSYIVMLGHLPSL